MLGFGLGRLGTIDNGVVRFRCGGPRLLDQAEERLASVAGFPSIESEGEFVQVVLQMLVADGALVPTTAARPQKVVISPSEHSSSHVTPCSYKQAPLRSRRSLMHSL
jgi:hypothetical protein